MKWFVPRMYAAQRLSEMPIRPVELYVDYESKLAMRWFMSRKIPEETGGVILHNGACIERPNLARNRRSNFEMEASSDEDIYAFWHTHPRGPESFSNEDAEMMQQMANMGLYWPWLIVSPATMTTWQYDATPSTA